MKSPLMLELLPVPFLKSRASKEVTSRWPVSSGQQSARVDPSLLALSQSLLFHVPLDKGNEGSGNEIALRMVPLFPTVHQFCVSQNGPRNPDF